MANTSFTKQGARLASRLAGEMFDALAKSKQPKFLGKLNEICLFLEAAQRVAPDSDMPQAPVKQVEPQAQEPQAEPKTRRKFTYAEIDDITTLLRARMRLFADRVGGNPLYEFDDLTDSPADLQDELPPMIVITFNVCQAQSQKLVTQASQARTSEPF